MFLGRLKILTDSHHFTTYCKKVVHSLQNFFAGFTKTEHNARLATNAGFCNMLENFKRAIIGCKTSHIGSQSSDCLEIVRDYIRAFCNDDIKQFELAFKVRDKYFHCRSGAFAFDGTNHFCPVISSAVIKVIAIDRSDNYMLEIECFNGIYHIVNLFFV